MKKLIIKVLVFTVPICCWFIIEGILPPSTYTYRPWEALDYQTLFGLGRFFYPNSEIQMESVGELCHHTKNSVSKGNFLKNPTVIGTGKKSLLQVASINYLVTWVRWRPANNYARWFYYKKVLALTV